MTNTQLQKKKDGKDNSMAEHFTQISQQEAVNWEKLQNYSDYSE